MLRCFLAVVLVAIRPLGGNAGPGNGAGPPKEDEKP